MMAGLADAIGAPYGNRTRVSAVKGRRPGPLDEGRMGEPPDGGCHFGRSHAAAKPVSRICRPRSAARIVGFAGSGKLTNGRYSTLISRVPAAGAPALFAGARPSGCRVSGRRPLLRRVAAG